MNCTAWCSALDCGGFPLDLQPDFPTDIGINISRDASHTARVLYSHNFQRVREYLPSVVGVGNQDQLTRTHHLTTTSSATGHEFPEWRYAARLRVHRPSANKVIHRKFDRFLRRNTLGNHIWRSRFRVNDIMRYSQLIADQDHDKILKSLHYGAPS